MTTIKIYVPEEEKKRLEDHAKEKGLSLSAYIKSQLHTDLNAAFALPQKESISRKRGIFIRTTDEEYNNIKKNAAGMTLASYARMALLSAGHPINIKITSNDLTEFDWKISEQLNHFQNMIEALAYRKTIQPQEEEKLLSCMQEVRNEIKELNRQIRNNRNSIRNAGLRWLKYQYRKAKEDSI